MRDLPVLSMDVLGGFRSRLRIPLETISAYALVIVSCVRQGFHSPQPLRVCGHVYAHLPSSIYIAILVGATVAIIAKLFGVVGRTKQLLRDRSIQRPARLMPGAGIDNLEGRTALFTTRSNFLVASALYLGIAASMTWLIGKDVPECYIAFGGILAVLALNLLFGILRAAFKEKTPKTFHDVSLFLAVLATDRDYEDPGLERPSWNPTPSDEAKAGASETFHVSHGSAVLDVDDDDKQLLYIRGTGKFGMQFKTKALNFGLGRVGDPVKIDRQERNFRLIPVRVPYALVWYSVYSAILAQKGYRGADEIDKCGLWLLLVSALSGFVVACIPGPCVVVKDNKQQGTTRHDVNREASNLALGVP